MGNVQVLDCTLRDGGRIIDCAFQNREIKEMSDKLANAKIDIVEVGFLRNAASVTYVGNSTFFTDVDQIIPFVDKESTTMFVAFIDFGMFDFATLKEYDGKSIDGIRFGFTKADYTNHYDEVITGIETIKEKGYTLFIQGVNSLNYSDKEMLELVELVNTVHPYSFGIVDTYGAMYVDDVQRLYRLVDNNMNSDICINFHSHNNYQLSFSFAQEIVKLSKGTRKVIVDATLNGIGKVAGNLNTELIVDYLVRKLNYHYELDVVLDIIDEYIYKYELEHKWGYSIPAMMAGVYKSHPNNIIYLTEKFRLGAKDIGKVLSMIDDAKRQTYDYDNIEALYTQYIADKIDDAPTLQKLKEIIADQPVLVLAPGNTLNTHKEVVDSYIKEYQPIIISVNFVSDYQDALCYYGNAKRYERAQAIHSNQVNIISSNIRSTDRNDLMVNYHSLINRGNKYFENSTIMLLNLLKKINVTSLAIAGFDGFSETTPSNYADASFQNARHKHEFAELNKEISKMLVEYRQMLLGQCTVKIITPSIYDTF